jgi:RNA polymerase sigma factor (TIGR02999 family)
MNVEALIQRWRDGDADARDQLVELLYPELRMSASAQMRRERDVSFSSGDLINDAILRLVRMGRIDIADRAHIIALAARLMRNILVDHARQKGADKRHHQKVELDPDIDGDQRLDLISLETALKRLGAIDMQLAELVEIRYFGGMPIGDTAVVTGLSEAKLERRWRTARAWLHDAVQNPIDA